MGVPQVVIVGRPNVGKSSIFNWLARKRLAIVDKQAGVTRDRMNYLMCEEDRYFDLVDTGGMGHLDADNLTDEVEDQITVALENAAVILFVVDGRDGLTAYDQEVSKRLRYLNAPIITVVNKIDDSSLEPNANEFYKMGRGKQIYVSTLQNRGRQDLIDLILSRLPEATEEEKTPEDVEMKIAIVGRRNVGKSTFINTLAQAERVIVSEVPGTTRDSIDVRFELDGKTLVAIDTPGLRRRKSITTDIDFYGKHRAERSIRRADVVLLFFDPSQPISKVDKQLCDYILTEYRPCIFVVNKWDLFAGDIATEKWVKYLRDTFRSMHHVPIAFITGQTGKNVKALINHAQMLFKQSRTRVSTGELNRVLRFALKTNPPPLNKSNRRLKIYYAAQVDTQPPTLVLFCNDPTAIMPTYRRYLLGVLRDQLSFGEVPIKLYLRRREEKDYSASQVGGVELRDMLEDSNSSDMLAVHEIESDHSAAHDFDDDHDFEDDDDADVLAESDSHTGDDVIGDDEE